VVKEEPESKDDMINTRFEVKVKMKSTEYEKQLLEADIQRYSQMPDAMGNPSLTLKDAMMIREIEDGKLARWYLTKTYEENRRNALKESQLMQQQNAQLQQQSNEQAAQKAIQLQQDKLAAEKEMEDFKATKQKELSLLNGLMGAIQKGIINPAIIMPAIQQLVPNIQIPLTMENKQMVEGIQAQAMQEQMAAQQEAQEQGQPMEQNPQEEMQEQQQLQPQM
jgi:hypothetical protein